MKLPQISAGEADAGRHHLRSDLRVRLERSEPLCAAVPGLGDDDASASIGLEISLVEWFRLLQRVWRERADKTCRMSARLLALGATDFMVETMGGAATLEEAMQRVARGYNLMHGGAYNRVERRRGRLVHVIDAEALRARLAPAA